MSSIARVSRHPQQGKESIMFWTGIVNNEVVGQIRNIKGIKLDAHSFFHEFVA